MSQPPSYAEPTEWMCANCNLPLEPAQVTVAYLGNAYPVEMRRCPKCGLVFVPENLALGKMLDVEQALEDK